MSSRSAEKKDDSSATISGGDSSGQQSPNSQTARQDVDDKSINKMKRSDGLLPTTGNETNLNHGAKDNTEETKANKNSSTTVVPAQRGAQTNSDLKKTLVGRRGTLKNRWNHNDKKSTLVHQHQQITNKGDVSAVHCHHDDRQKTPGLSLMDDDSEPPLPSESERIHGMSSSVHYDTPQRAARLSLVDDGHDSDAANEGNEPPLPSAAQEVKVSKRKGSKIHKQRGAVDGSRPGAFASCPFNNSGPEVTRTSEETNQLSLPAVAAVAGFENEPSRHTATNVSSEEDLESGNVSQVVSAYAVVEEEGTNQLQLQAQIDQLAQQLARAPVAEAVRLGDDDGADGSKSGGNLKNFLRVHRIKVIVTCVLVVAALVAVLAAVLSKTGGSGSSTSDGSAGLPVSSAAPSSSPPQTAAPSSSPPQKIESFFTTLSYTHYFYGHMFDIRAKNDINVIGIQIHLRSTAQEPLEVWTRAGPYHGYETYKFQWAKLGETTVTGMGTGNLTPLPNDTFRPVSVQAGQVQSFYVTSPAKTIVYFQERKLSNGTDLIHYGDKICENSDLELNVGTGVQYLFQNHGPPNIFNGALEYALVGETQNSSSHQTNVTCY